MNLERHRDFYDYLDGLLFSEDHAACSTNGNAKCNH